MQLVFTVAGTAAGAVVGTAFGNPVLGAQIGMMVGSTVGGMLFAPTITQRTVGPRLDNLDVTLSGYGATIHRVYGIGIVSGYYLASTTLRERRHVKKSSQSAGKGGAKTTIINESFTYDIECVIGVCEGTRQILKIYIGAKLLVDLTGQSSPTGFLNAGGKYQRMDLYEGTETQGINSIYSSIVGPTKASGLRGITYVAFKKLDVTEFNGNPPQFTFLVAETTQLTSIDSTTFAKLGPANQSLLTFSYNAYHYSTQVLTWRKIEINPGASSIGANPYHFWYSTGYIDANGNAVDYGILMDYDYTNHPYHKRGILSRWFKIIHNAGGGVRFVKSSAILLAFPWMNEDETGPYYPHATQHLNNSVLSPEQRCVMCCTFYDKSTSPYLYSAYGGQMWFMEWGGDQRLIQPITTPAGYNATITVCYAIAIYGNNLYYLVEANKRHLVHFDLLTGVHTTIIDGDALDVRYSGTGGELRVYIDGDGIWVLYQEYPSATWLLNMFDHGNSSVVTSYDFQANSKINVGLFVASNYAYVPIFYLGTHSLYRYDLTASQPIVPTNLGVYQGSPNTNPTIPAMDFNDTGGVIHSYYGWSTGLFYYWGVIGTNIGSTGTLADLITALVEESGVSASEINVTDISAIPVRGYQIDQRGANREAITQLLGLFGVISRDNDGIMEFIDLRTPTEHNITTDDLASNIEGALDQVLTYKDTHEGEMTKELDFAYRDADMNYEVNIVSVSNPTITSDIKRDIRIPIVMTKAEAAEAVDTMAAREFKQRLTYEGSLSMKNVDILPGYVINVTVSGVAHKILVANVDWGVNLPFQGISFDPATLDNTVAAGDTSGGQIE